METAVTGAGAGVFAQAPPSHEVTTKHSFQHGFLSNTHVHAHAQTERCLKRTDAMRHEVKSTTRALRTLTHTCSRCKGGAMPGGGAPAALQSGSHLSATCAKGGREGA